MTAQVPGPSNADGSQSEQSNPISLSDENARLRAQVSELERQLQAVRQTDQYRALFEQSADAILIIDGDRFVDCNQATVEMLRYADRAELLKTHPSELSPEFQPDGRPSFEKANEMMASAFERGSHRFEWNHMRADGEVFPVEVLLTAVPEGDRKILHVVWRDITERKLLEDQLRHAQKMEAVGKLAGGVAHDFNNLLVAILGHSELMELTLTNKPDLQQRISEIRRAAQRAAALTRQLLAFSRKQVLQLKVIDLNQVLAELQRMLTRLISEDIEMSVRCWAEPLMIKADAGQIEQVVVNLVTNARDAMPQGGRLTIMTAIESLTEPDGSPQSLAPGRYAVVAVSDNGVGMDHTTRQRAFDPFFTTKELGRGTGLGLATVYGIVRQSGGAVQLESEPGQGTTVKAFLPLTSEAPVIEQIPPLTRVAGGGETILVVEDDPSVAHLIVDVLRSDGYLVHQASNGVEALELVESKKLRFDLLLTDVVMPKMGGPELAEQLKRRHRDCRVLYVSGYTGDALNGRGSLDEGIDIILKPFSPQLLSQRIRQALDRHRP